MIPVILKSVQSLPIEFLKEEDYNLTDDKILNEALRAAEAHRRVRYDLHRLLKPGVSLLEIVDTVEKNTRILLNGEKNNGIGFPCGVSLNDCAAHFTLNPGDKDIIVKETDILKIDFGVHSNGRIMDSAFTLCFDPQYEKLLEASKEATEQGIKKLGIDTMICEIGRDIDEVFKSFEMETKKGIIPIKQVYNLNGHSIEQFKIHGKFSIPSYDNGDSSRITEGFYAIETFATTGKGYVTDCGSCSHFMHTKNSSSSLKSSIKNADTVLGIIKKEIGTLPFSPKHLEYFMKGCSTTVKLLGARDIIDRYPPLVDSPRSKVAQFEHTVYLSEKRKEVLTRGDDY